MTNTLYYGDNLDILSEHVRDESVDLDPPFNSNAFYSRRITRFVISFSKWLKIICM